MDKRRFADMIGCPERCTDPAGVAPAARLRALARLAMSAMSNTVVRTQAVTALILQLRFDEVTRVAVAVGLAAGTAAALVTVLVAACAARPDPPEPGPAHRSGVPAPVTRMSPGGPGTLRTPRCATRP